MWYDGARRARDDWAELSAYDGLDVTVERGGPDWVISRRRWLIDLLEEYLKHTGDADVRRESVDGLRGNDPD